MSDIDIARNAKLQSIDIIAKSLGLKKEDLTFYGEYMAKIKDVKTNKKGKLVLVTSINPTPFGEGKTTTAIGLADGLTHIGKKACLALREPSLGPVFGIKGGATGGGHAQVIPMDNINLHFTGDIHAITTANNLISALIDNHVFHGNQLNIDPDRILFNRCLDLNERQLRNVNLGLGGEKSGIERMDHFSITAASEIMSIFCLATDLMDLKRRVGNILLAYDKNGNPIFGRDLKVEESVAILLKDAIRPNLVQTIEGTPALIHGGPFANISHGCNTIIATKQALALADYIVTEAGFGADLGAEKFFDIKCRQFGLTPDVVVLVAAIRALRYNGGATKDTVQEKNVDLVKKGISNLKRHIQNLKNNFNANVIVVLNKFVTDSEEEINLVKELAKSEGVEFSICSSWLDGGKGAEDLANKVVALSENRKKLKFLYDLEDSIKEKIEKVAINNYGAKNVVYTKEALKSIDYINKDKNNNLPICIAKTQYSFSDNPKLLGSPNDFEFVIRDVYVKSGAGYIVVVAGNMLLMPGLPSNPAALNMKIDKNNKIEGLF